MKLHQLLEELGLTKKKTKPKSKKTKGGKK